MLKHYEERDMFNAKYPVGSKVAITRNNIKFGTGEIVEKAALMIGDIVIVKIKMRTSTRWVLIKNIHKIKT